MIPGNAHRRQDARVDGNSSRIERDLTSFQQRLTRTSKHGPMLRTMATRWTIKRQPHVCVIGAGVAGLRCADVLLNAGAKVTIFEGRDRIGGRVSIRKNVEDQAKSQRFVKEI